METSSATLAERVGTMRAAAQADSARGWLPASLHALIMSVLVRIFGRLEQMLLLWQSGALPLPQPSSRRPSRRRAGSPRRTSRRRMRKARPESVTTRLRARTSTTRHPAAAPHRHAKPSARAVRLPPPH